MPPRIDKLRVMSEEAGRGRLPTTLQLAPPEPERLARFEQAGVTRVVWYLPPRDRDSIERALGRYAAIAAAYRSAGG